MLLSIFGAKAWDAPPQHGSMPSPERGATEQHRRGVGHPMTMATRHHLRLAGHGLDMDPCSVVFCPACTKLMGVSLVPLCQSASESAFR